jgi:ATP-dependent Clp protease protease subunit
VQIQANELLRWKDELTRVYEKHTGQPLEKLKADMERDNFMTAEQAVAYGLADRVVASRETENK